MALSLQDVFAMFEPFDITSAEVTTSLNACKDKSEAFNRFEGLKGLVSGRFEEMRMGDVSKERLEEVRPIYERLIGISLKNYTPQPKSKPTPKPKPSSSPKKKNQGLKDIAWEMFQSYEGTRGAMDREAFEKIADGAFEKNPDLEIDDLGYEEIWKLMKSAQNDRSKEALGKLLEKLKKDPKSD